MSPPPRGRGKDGSMNRTPSHALSPWSPAAPRNSISASPRRCRTRRPVPCNRRPWAPSPLPGGLEKDARGLWKDSGRPQVPQKPSFRRQRVRRDCACEPPCSRVYCLVPRPEATTALESALTLALRWLHPPAGTCEVDTGRGAEEPVETCTRWTRVSSPLDCLVGISKVAETQKNP